MASTSPPSSFLGSSFLGSSFASNGLVLLYILTMIVNGLVSTGTGVRLTNPSVSATHPVALTPPGWAFSIWGIIYLLVGAFVVTQALPLPSVHAESATISPLRPWIALALVCNCAWLFLFGWELLWLSFLVIAGYLLSLYRIVGSLDLDLVQADSPGYGLRLLAHAAFGANASWVTVATLLQLQINLLDEGYSSSADLTIALVCVAAGIACWRAFSAADLPWALVAAWALYAIRSTHLPGSDWGCLPAICAACDKGVQRICTNDRQPPLGWKTACSSPQRDGCLTERSANVANACLAGIVVVAVALVAGVVRGLLARQASAKLRTALSDQEM